MSHTYYANQYDGPFQRPHNQQWELDKAANGPFVKADWKVVPYDQPKRVKRDCGPFVRKDLKVKTACDVTAFVADDCGRLKKGFKDKCGIPFYGNYRGTWDLPASILGPRERHMMGRLSPNPRWRCMAEEIHVGRRNCDQWDNVRKAKQDAKDLGAHQPFPEDMNKQDIINWEKCTGRKMPYRVGKHTDAITLTPQPRLKRKQRWDPNRERCRKSGKRDDCEPDELLILLAPVQAKLTMEVKDVPLDRRNAVDFGCLRSCIAKCGGVGGRQDNKGNCDEGNDFKPKW